MSRLVIQLAFLLAFSFNAIANNEFDHELDEVVVTATRSAKTVDKTLSSVTIITRDDIERQQATSFYDLLRGIPGFSVTNNGGAGKVTSVFLRGTESDHVLVLINGIKVGSATLGTTAFQDIPVEQIERIEIVRGPHSSLYGSEAIGGVIQIFTKKSGGSIKPSFSIGGGSHDRNTISAGVSGGGSHGWFNTSISHTRTRGFNACRGSASAGCFTTEPDRDGYRNLSFALRAGHRFDNALEVDVHALRAMGNNKFDGSTENESRTVQQTIGGSLRYSPIKNWQATLTTGRSDDQSDNLRNSSLQSRVNTIRHTFSLQNNFLIAVNHLFSVGLDYQHDHVDSTTAYAVTSRDSKGLFAQYQATVAEHDLELSLRREDNRQFGENYTAGIAWGYPLSDNLRLLASYGTAFKAPSFNELYFPSFGNSDLRPERSRSAEIGLRGKGDAWLWSFSIYETRINDLIAYDNAMQASRNINKTLIQGAEVTISASIQDWIFSAGLTMLDAKDRSTGATNGNILPRRAERALKVDVDRHFGKYRLGASLHAESDRFDDIANRRRLSGYATVDIRGEYLLLRNWSIQLRLANVFNKNYETTAFYNQEGQSLLLTLRYRP